MAAPKIKAYSRIIPMVYAYNTPGIPYHEGWTKIGYTERQAVEDRIKQQTGTANIRWSLAWKDNAMYRTARANILPTTIFTASYNAGQI